MKNIKLYDPFSMDRLNRLYLVRHGQVLRYNGMAAFGQTDVDITEVGNLQMQYLAERLRFVNIKAIYSSDLKRSVTGARIIARYHDVPHAIMPDLKEIFFGYWEGMSKTEIDKDYPGELEKRQADIVNYHPPGNGESISDLSGRVMPCLQSIMEEQKGNDILLVAHGEVNRIIICKALGLELANIFSIHQDYGCLNIIDYFPNYALIRLMNG